MRNLILTGFAGTGKTTVGKQLALRLHAPFVDMDQLIERRQSRSIQELFEQEGEPFFRQLETALCGEIANWQGYVIATGGGTLINCKNLSLLGQENMIICLDCDIRQIWHRLAAAHDRPLFHSTNPEHKFAQMAILFKQREAAYARLPHHVDTTNRSVGEVVTAIMTLVRGKWGHHDHLLPLAFPLPWHLLA